MEAVHLFFAATIGLALGAIVTWIRLKLRWRDDLKAACDRSVNLSRSTLKGQIGEQLAPLLPGFCYAASDARFLGDPIDYVVFNGYTELKDGSGSEELEVVILDIKQGRSRLSPTQRAVAAAVRAGRVRFEVVRITETGQVHVEEPH